LAVPGQKEWGSKMKKHRLSTMLPDFPHRKGAVLESGKEITVW
jgi:hypothetical protein